MAKGSFFNKVKDLAKSVGKTHNEREYDDDEDEFDDFDSIGGDDYLEQLEHMKDSRPAAKQESYTFNPSAGYTDTPKTNTAESQHNYYAQQSAASQAQRSDSGNVFKMPSQPKPAPKQASKFRFAFMKIDKIEDTVAVAEQIITGNTVVLIDMHGITQNNARRITDFLDGVVYTCNARMELIADFTYVTVPESVELSGDFLSQVDTTNFTFR